VGCLPGEKISRKGAEAQRGVFFFAALRLCEKKIISRKAAKPQRGAKHKFQVFTPYFPTIVNVGANKHSPKLRYQAKPTVGCFYTPPRGGASPMPDYPRHFRKKRRCGHCRIFHPAGGAAGDRWANVYSPLRLELGGEGGNGLVIWVMMLTEKEQTNEHGKPWHGLKTAYIILPR
jgi:hypothetical protein